MRTIGIIAALQPEISGLLESMRDNVVIHRIGQRDYYVGSLLGCSCVIVLARVGKVAAAATTATLIREFGVACVVFTGVAGAIGSHVRVGDVVIAQSLVQHDLDASPLFPRYEVPLLGRSHFEADPHLTQLLTASARQYLEHDLPSNGASAAQLLCRFGIARPLVHGGIIISGDSFINDAQRVRSLRAELPGALCVEMEGAAVAQVCHEYETPYAVMRTISDCADGSACIDFNEFLTVAASRYSAGILRRFLLGWPAWECPQDGAAFQV